MIAEKLYAFTAQGVQEITIGVRNLQVAENLAAAFSGHVSRSIDNMVYIGGPYGFAGVNITDNGFTRVSVRVAKLALETHYQTSGDTLYPAFRDTSLPVMRIDWTPPADMQLLLVLYIERQSAATYNLFEQYLVAMDSNGRCYRLPISNIYNNCKLCHGMDKSVFKSVMDAVMAAAKQLNASRWNADLYSAENGLTSQEATRLMFSFKPKNDGFEQVPLVLPHHWTTLSSRISLDALEKSLTKPSL